MLNMHIRAVSLYPYCLIRRIFSYLCLEIEDFKNNLIDLDLLLGSVLEGVILLMKIQPLYQFIIQSNSLNPMFMAKDQVNKAL